MFGIYEHNINVEITFNHINAMILFISSFIHGYLSRWIVKQLMLKLPLFLTFS